MSCCGGAKLQGGGCTWISPALAALLSTAQGFPAKTEQASTVRKKLFRALNGFTKT